MVRGTPQPHFTHGKHPVSTLQEAGWAPGPVWTGGKSRPHRDSIPDRPARSQSLYRLRSYPALLTKKARGKQQARITIYSWYTELLKSVNADNSPQIRRTLLTYYLMTSQTDKPRGALPKSEGHFPALGFHQCMSSPEY